MMKRRGPLLGDTKESVCSDFPLMCSDFRIPQDYSGESSMGWFVSGGSFQEKVYLSDQKVSVKYLS